MFHQATRDAMHFLIRSPRDVKALDTSAEGKSRCADDES